MVSQLAATGIYAARCISDSFTFADYIRKLDGQIDSFMCLFAVSSLFTNVWLDETIAICADTLHNIPDSQPCIPKEVFVELLHSATSMVEFSFDNTIYTQIDGVAMGSPLGTASANVFVEYYEKKLFFKISKPAMYFRYVDDTFVIFQNEKESEIFLIRLNVYIPLFSLVLKRRRTTLFLSLTSTLNTRRSATKRKFIANLGSQASTFAGNPLHG